MEKVQALHLEELERTRNQCDDEIARIWTLAKARSGHLEKAEVVLKKTRLEA